MRNKAFTLIELLVVVAIIGILAAVGVVAYNGYTGAAKIKTLQTNHNAIIKYLKAELMKCELGIETEAYEKKISNPTKYRGLSDAPCSKRFAVVGGNIMAYISDFEEEFGIKNPLNPDDPIPITTNSRCPSIMSGPDANLGRMHYSNNNATATIVICTRYGTGNNDVWKATIDNPY
jgi:prepilin-type N-terminal cleavage/methylation domain-containing protein